MVWVKIRDAQIMASMVLCEYVLAYGLKTDPTKLRFSPTAIALGSSAIVKLSGQNCFRTLYGSLGQIRLGPPKGSGGQVPPRFSKFRGVSGSPG